MEGVASTMFPLLDHVMPRRIRQCVECPKYHTRYLIGCSPYHNGSYLFFSHPSLDSVRLYCVCSDSPSFNAFRWNELKMYAASNFAQVLCQSRI